METWRGEMLPEYEPAKHKHKWYWIHVVSSRNLKGGIGSLFDPCVNAMRRQPCWPSRMEVSYCTFGFGANILRDLRTLSLPHDSPHYLSPPRKGNSCLRDGLRYEKIRRYNNSAPCVTARWPPQQIPPLNFLGSVRAKSFSLSMLIKTWSFYEVAISEMMLKPLLK